MNISNYASQKLLNEFTKTEVVVTYMREVITIEWELPPISEESSETIIEKPEFKSNFQTIFRPFTVLINGRFESFADGFNTVSIMYPGIRA
jgi:hypothetical protein